MATLIGSSGAGDDLIRKLHDMGVSRSCTTIRQVMERREAIDQIIELERERQGRLLDKEMRSLRQHMRKSRIKDTLLFFNKNKESAELLRQIDHLKNNRETIIDNNLMYLYREKDVLDKMTREYRSELKGYYGELLVMDSLKELGDDFYVISDVWITRETGHKFDGKMLKSARVDHVVVGRKGVYCVETKNWNSRWKFDDKPTPGGQARRASHLLYRYLKYTCGLGGIKVLSIVLYTNSSIKGREDFVRFLRYDEFTGYLAQRQDVLTDVEIQKIVEAIKGRDIRFDDTMKDVSPEEEESLKLLEVSGEETT